MPSGSAERCAEVARLRSELDATRREYLALTGHTGTAAQRRTLRARLRALRERLRALGERFS